MLCSFVRLRADAYYFGFSFLHPLPASCSPSHPHRMRPSSTWESESWMKQLQEKRILLPSSRLHSGVSRILLYAVLYTIAQIGKSLIHFRVFDCSGQQLEESPPSSATARYLIHCATSPQLTQERLVPPLLPADPVPGDLNVMC